MRREVQYAINAVMSLINSVLLSNCSCQESQNNCSNVDNLRINISWTSAFFIIFRPRTVHLASLSTGTQWKYQPP